LIRFCSLAPLSSVRRFIAAFTVKRSARPSIHQLFTYAPALAILKHPDLEVFLKAVQAGARDRGSRWRRWRARIILVVKEIHDNCREPSFYESTGRPTRRPVLSSHTLRVIS
jgi:hypothetical protein